MSFWNTNVQLLRVKFGENNKVVILLGKWKKSQCFGQAVPVIGLAYDMTTPPTLVCTHIHFLLKESIVGDELIK